MQREPILVLKDPDLEETGQKCDLHARAVHKGILAIPVRINVPYITMYGIDPNPHWEPKYIGDQGTGYYQYTFSEAFPQAETEEGYTLPYEPEWKRILDHTLSDVPYTLHSSLGCVIVQAAYFSQAERYLTALTSRPVSKLNPAGFFYLAKEVIAQGWGQIKADSQYNLFYPQGDIDKFECLKSAWKKSPFNVSVSNNGYLFEMKGSGEHIRFVLSKFYEIDTEPLWGLDITSTNRLPKSFLND